MIGREADLAPRSHSGARKSKESAGKREATHCSIGARGGTGAFRTGVQIPHVAALLGHVVPATGRKAANSVLSHYYAAAPNIDTGTLFKFQSFGGD